MITGVPSAIHGIYGNTIWKGRDEGFRHANWTDIKSTNIAEHASSAGLKVANLGFGMLNPAHSEIYYPPIWTHEMLHSTDTNKQTVADKNWIDQAQLAKQETWLQNLEALGLSLIHI